jgi:hypothetical protein
MHVIWALAPVKRSRERSGLGFLATLLGGDGAGGFGRGGGPGGGPGGFGMLAIDMWIVLVVSFIRADNHKILIEGYVVPPVLALGIVSLVAAAYDLDLVARTADLCERLCDSRLGLRRWLPRFG